MSEYYDQDRLEYPLTPYNLEGFIARPDAYQALGRLTLHAPNIAVVADFDGLLTEKQADGVKGTQFDILRRQMVSDENREMYEKVRGIYQPQEHAGTLSEHSSVKWQSVALAQMKGASIEKIQKDANVSMAIRPGVRSFFQMCEEYGFPVSVRSAGCYEIISKIAERESLRITQYVTNRFTTEEDGDTINGILPSAFTHSRNKNRIGLLDKDGKPLRGSNGQPYHGFVVVGDSPHDSQMMSRRFAGSTLRIRQDGGKAQHEAKHCEGSYDTYAQESHSKHDYHLVAEDNDFTAMQRLLTHLGEAALDAA